jgi:anti-sigma regulatory factor (Ser/Thr protein kinase)
MLQSEIFEVTRSCIPQTCFLDESLDDYHFSARNFPPALYSARDMRSYVRQKLNDWEVAWDGDDVVIVVSELVTNAVSHVLLPRQSNEVGWLSLTHTGNSLICMVYAPGAYVLETPLETGSLKESGRGLKIVAALSAHWGVSTIPGGRVVWSHLVG